MALPASCSSSTWCWTAATSAPECFIGSWPRRHEERRQVVAAIGPLWSWHEVWLVGFGGTLLAVFPKLLASAFAGYYLALFLILWCLILRGISLEVGGHINDRMWQGFWDFVFVLANTLLAILFGAAAGNMARGVPLASDGTFLDGLLHRFHAARLRGTARLVHGIRCALRRRRRWRRTARPISR